MDMENKSFEINDIIKDKIFKSFLFWEKKRLLFNILVGITGLLVLFYLYKFTFFYFTLFEIVGVFIWAFVANAMYSIGFVSESIIIYYSSGRKDYSNIRLYFFYFGTLLYILFSLFYGFLLGNYSFPLD